MPTLLPIFSGLWSLATSTLGMILIAAVVGFSSGHHRASVACTKREAEARAAAVVAQQAEASRQAKAADAIAATDRARLAAGAKADAAMAAEIDRLQSELAKKEADHVPAPAGTKTAVVDRCDIDADFAGRVRQHDAAGAR
ncbi:MAG: hypothetical protein ACR652_26185 [Methylocystis sp.]|uniref:hypothetical protein n=1 Tax=Methylocystis sp. TaxID=1911079 RepID=UPI003DA691D4